MRENITLLLLIIIIIGASISIGYMASNDIESMISKIQNDYGDSPEECVNLSLKGTAYCLLAYVETIYKYTETKDSIGLTLEELIEKGGDCKNCNSKGHIHHPKLMACPFCDGDGYRDIEYEGDSSSKHNANRSEE